MLVNEPERLENVDYAIVIRASFDSTNLGNENSEHTSHSADSGAVIPMVMVNDTLYLYTGFENTDAHHDVMNGKITSSVHGNTKPTVNDQSNFGEDTHISTVLPKEPLKSTWMVNGASLLLKKCDRIFNFLLLMEMLTDQTELSREKLHQ